MNGTPVKVRFKLAWQTYQVGDEITPSGTLRGWLVGNGYADEVHDEHNKAPVNRQMKAPNKRTH